MKKLLIAAALAAGVVSAQAADVVVRGSHNFSEAQNWAGIAVTSKLGPVQVETGFDRTVTGDLNANRFSAVAVVPVLKVKAVQFTARAGAGYITRGAGEDGAVGLAGLGLELPVDKTVSFVMDYQYQLGQDRVSGFDGSLVTAGIKVKF
jgi:opacity protein-like surface antigen